MDTNTVNTKTIDASEEDIFQLLPRDQQLLKLVERVSMYSKAANILAGSVDISLEYSQIPVKHLRQDLDRLISRIYHDVRFYIHRSDEPCVSPVYPSAGNKTNGSYHNNASNEPSVYEEGDVSESI